MDMHAHFQLSHVLLYSIFLKVKNENTSPDYASFSQSGGGKVKPALPHARETRAWEATQLVGMGRVNLEERDISGGETN